MEASKNYILESVQEDSAKLIKTLEAKNKDYAGDGDPFKNFKSSLRINVPVQTAMLIRLQDKVTRLENLLSREEGPAVKSESIEDTLDDLIGYAYIIKAWRKLQNQQDKKFNEYKRIGQEAFNKLSNKNATQMHSQSEAY